MQIQKQNRNGEWDDLASLNKLSAIVINDYGVLVESFDIDAKTGDQIWYRVRLSAAEIAWLDGRMQKLRREQAGEG
jgi:hypothetical protein